MIRMSVKRYSQHAAPGIRTRIKWPKAAWFVWAAELHRVLLALSQESLMIFFFSPLVASSENESMTSSTKEKRQCAENATSWRNTPLVGGMMH